MVSHLLLESPKCDTKLIFFSSQCLVKLVTELSFFRFMSLNCVLVTAYSALCVVLL